MYPKDVVLEIRLAAESILDELCFMSDIIDGDTCGDIENDGAKDRLDMLRMKLRGMATLIRGLSYEVEEVKKEVR